MLLPSLSGVTTSWTGAEEGPWNRVVVASGSWSSLGGEVVTLEKYCLFCSESNTGDHGAARAVSVAENERERWGFTGGVLWIMLCEDSSGEGCVRATMSPISLEVISMDFDMYNFGPRGRGLAGIFGESEDNGDRGLAGETGVRERDGEMYGEMYGEVFGFGEEFGLDMPRPRSEFVMVSGFESGDVLVEADDEKRMLKRALDVLHAWATRLATRVRGREGPCTACSSSGDWTVDFQSIRSHLFRCKIYYISPDEHRTLHIPAWHTLFARAVVDAFIFIVVGLRLPTTGALG